MIDTQRFGEMALEFIEDLAEDVDDAAELGVVAIVAEVKHPDWTRCRVFSSDDRRWVQRGLMAWAAECIETTTEESE